MLIGVLQTRGASHLGADHGDTHGRGRRRGQQARLHPCKWCTARTVLPNRSRFFAHRHKARSRLLSFSLSSFVHRIPIYILLPLSVNNVSAFHSTLISRSLHARYFQS